MRRPTVALAFVAFATLAGGCGERAEPLEELPPRYPVTVTGAGEEPLVVDAAPRRLVALDHGPAELVARLGAGERLVGVPAGTRLPPSARGRRVVTTVGGAVNVGAVADLRPDLILATSTTDTVDLARAERRSEAPVYLQPAESVADVLRATLELGFLLGEPARARRLAGTIRRGVATAEERVAERARVRVFVDTGLFVTVPDRSLIGDLVRRAGGVNVGARRGGNALGPCNVARLKPDVILVIAARGAPRPAARTYACRGRLPERVAFAPEDVVTVAGPRVPAGVAAIARALHPDAFG